MRRWLFVCTFFAATTGAGWCFDLDKALEIQTLNVVRGLNQNNPASALATYRSMLEVVGAAKTLGSTGNQVAPSPQKNTTFIVNGTPTIIEKDSRTQANFEAVSARTDRIWIGVGTEQQGVDIFPDAVAIRTNLGGMCSGALVKPDTVLTAAHCFCSGNTPELVIFGRTTDLGAQSTRIVQVDKPNSKQKMECGKYQQGDIGLVRLKESVQVLTRRIASPAQVTQAKSVRLVGFGRTENNNSGTKLMVDVPITSHDCQGTSSGGTDAAVYGCTPDFELVASSPLTNQDSCNGDSGGGVFVSDDNDNFLLAAVISRGIQTPNVRPCGDGGIYPRIDGAAMRQWLAANGVP